MVCRDAKYDSVVELVISFSRLITGQMVRYMVALDGSEGAQKAFDLCLKIAKTNDIVFLITVLQGDNSPKAKEDANNMIINHERVCQEKGVSTNYT